MIINRDEIYILLNHYALQGRTRLTVEYPPFNLKLFTIHLRKMRIEDVVDEKNFESLQKKFGKNEFMRHDLPNYRDLLDVFISSGIVEFENREEIDENFKLLREASEDRTIYIKPVFIGIDTNIAYYRVISRRFMNHFKYVISRIVIDEIDSKIHTKYTGRMLRHFQSLPYGNLVMEFANGSVKDARKAKNAMNEIYYLTNRLDAFVTGQGTETKDREIRDREIVESYRKFSDEINAEVVLLTADKDMMFHAQAQQLSAIYYKLPHNLAIDEKIDPRKISYLLYDLTAVFGIVKVNNTIILGEWRGKTSEDYFNERLNVFESDLNYEKDVKICRGVMDEFQRDAL